PPDKLSSIFRRFEQVDSSDARDRGGTGLGLAISRSIIERLGGRIWAENNPDVGATFTFTLPRSTAVGPISDDTVRDQHPEPAVRG
ncbi:MAG TPA: ATP-binding protein, partial [Microlunatus sp.]